LGHEESVLLASWPEWDDAALRKDRHLIVIQVNGKLRSRMEVDDDTEEKVIREMALSDEKVQKFIAGKAVRQIVVVKNKLINIVV